MGWHRARSGAPLSVAEDGELTVAPRRRNFDAETINSVLSGRRSGLSWDQIEAHPQMQGKLRKGDAQASWNAAIESSPAEVNRALELDRLEALHRAAWPAASRGDLAAIEKVTRLLELRMRLRAQAADNDHALTRAFEESVKTSRQLVAGLDDALIAAGRRLAERVDEAVATGDGQEVTKALYLLPHMMNVLREALATPASRLEKGITQAKGQTQRSATLAMLRGGNDGNSGASA